MNLEQIVQQEQAQVQELFVACVEKYMSEHEFRIYIRDSEFSEYAKTFKIIKLKPRRKRK